MQLILADRFEAVRPAIRAHWAAALQHAPAPPAAPPGLVTPAMLVLMIDDTLALLGKALREERVRKRTACAWPRLAASRPGCRCGLHLLIGYYLAGARALRKTLPANLGRERVAVLREFNGLAHAEMAALCGVCLHRGGSYCRLEETLNLPARAASPATPSVTRRSRDGTRG